jgi:hypothetical protein
MQNFANHTKKIEKKFEKSRDEVFEMSEALDKIDERMVRLIEALVSNGTIKQEDIDPPPKPQPVQRARAVKNEKSKRHSSDSETEEESEEESDHDSRRRGSDRDGSRGSKSRGNSRSMPPPRRGSDRGKHDNRDSGEGDDIDAVVRMASGRRN